MRQSFLPPNVMLQRSCQETYTQTVVFGCLQRFRLGHSDLKSCGSTVQVEAVKGTARVAAAESDLEWQLLGAKHYKFTCVIVQFSCTLTCLKKVLFGFEAHSRVLPSAVVSMWQVSPPLPLPLCGLSAVCIIFPVRWNWTGMWSTIRV